MPRVSESSPPWCRSCSSTCQTIQARDNWTCSPSHSSGKVCCMSAGLQRARHSVIMCQVRSRPCDQLSGRSGGPVRLLPAHRRHVRAAVLAQGLGEPADTAADDVRGILADGAQARRGAQRELLGGERRQRRREALLVRFPRGIERRERKVVFSHLPISSCHVWFIGRSLEQWMQCCAPLTVCAHHAPPISRLSVAFSMLPGGAICCQPLAMLAAFLHRRGWDAR